MVKALIHPFISRFLTVLMGCVVIKELHLVRSSKELGFSKIFREKAFSLIILSICTHLMAPLKSSQLILFVKITVFVAATADLQEPLPNKGVLR